MSSFPNIKILMITASETNLVLSESKFWSKQNSQSVSILLQIKRHNRDWPFAMKIKVFVHEGKRLDIFSFSFNKINKRDVPNRLLIS